MSEEDNQNIDSDFANLILILLSVWIDEDGDKFRDKKKDWLLDQDGAKVYL